MGARSQALASYTARSRRPPLSAAASGSRQVGSRLLARTPGVEVAGIEPASYDASPGLLRAQSALSLLDPIDLTDKSM